ncbi:hypothetical protein OG241_05475 [Streptomyces sp. NBC_01390]|uniref:hypothetical protein n=1 Tax=Streptomyces sp. NBC_01390 TaxID=2903850 RepID=UPI0032509699
MRLVERYQEAARTMIAAARGFVAQTALFGDTSVEVFHDGLRGLMSLGGPARSEPGGSQAG